jgi:ribosomal protein S18 acetylase RimI-like enzyme
VYIREATATEMTEVGEIRVAAYQAGGFLPENSDYADRLRTLGTEGGDDVLVAVVPDSAEPEAAERIVGTVMLQFWPRAGQIVTGPKEAEIRALAVRPQIQGGGVGSQLLRRVIARAAEAGIDHLVLCTEPEMRTAHHLYEQAGFVRLPERDWSPVQNVSLLAYGLHLR